MSGDAPTLHQRVGASYLGRHRPRALLTTAVPDEAEWQRRLASEARGYCFVARVVRDVVGRDMLGALRRRRIQRAAAGR